MTAIETEPNCIDIVRPFVARLEDNPSLPGVQLMGGIGSAALKHEGTVILPDERRIVTTDAFLRESPDLGRYRQNGTLRDMDALVLSDDESQVAAIEKIAEEEIGDGLDISVFRLVSGSQLDEQRAAPFGAQALKTFVSDRYVREDGGLDKALFPFAVPIDSEIMDSWTLEVDAQEYKVMNPAVAILNYLTRSISGLRPKDYDKVQDMAKLVFGKSPELADWAVDGPGRSHMEFAGILQTLRRSNTFPRSKRILSVGGALEIRAGSVRSLRDHEAFMMHDADGQVQDAVLLMAVLKARGLGIGESNEDVVRVFQKFVEGRIGSITKNT